MKKQFQKQAGLTLIELLVCLAVLSILVSLAVSGFSMLIDATRMNSHVNNLVHSLHTARQISRAKGAEIAVCKSPDGEQCTTAGNWHDGWLIFVNSDHDSPPHLDPGETLLEVHGSVTAINISSNRRSFSMRPYGKRSTNGTLIYCDRRGSNSARSVIVSYTGKPRVSDKDASGRVLTCADHS